MKGGRREGRESFFPSSKVFKYLYLLFDNDHPLLHAFPPGEERGTAFFDHFVFTTKGHILPIPQPSHCHNDEL